MLLTGFRLRSRSALAHEVAHVCATAALGDARAMHSSHSAARYFRRDFDGVSGRLSGFTSAVLNMIESWAARSFELSASRS